MPTSVMPLVAQTVLEGGVVAWAGWEVWKLRTPKPKDAASSDLPRAAGEVAGAPATDGGGDVSGPTPPPSQAGEV